jgi:hypothetical protein
MGGRRVDHDHVRDLASLAGPQRMTYDEIAAKVGCCESYVRLIIKGKVGARRVVHSRMASGSLEGVRAGMPPIDNASINASRTLYPSTVFEVDGYEHRILKSGFNSAKIGRRIVKGRWKGFEVYTLTLEERATCPQSCRHWRSCFGNGMPKAHRIAHGPAFEARLAAEVRALGKRHSRGFAVRLHVLGDFYSPGYVALWASLLREVPQLHVFGFSARWDYQNDDTARALIDLTSANWMRFAIRFSNAPIDECSTVSIEHPFQKPADAIICPQQTGKTEACSTCGLCWQSTRRIAFLQH